MGGFSAFYNREKSSSFVYIRKNRNVTRSPKKTRFVS